MESDQAGISSTNPKYSLFYNCSILQSEYLAVVAQVRVRPSVRGWSERCALPQQHLNTPYKQGIRICPFLHREDRTVLEPFVQIASGVAEGVTNNPCIVDHRVHGIVRVSVNPCLRLHLNDQLLHVADKHAVGWTRLPSGDHTLPTG